MVSFQKIVVNSRSRMKERSWKIKRQNNKKKSREREIIYLLRKCFMPDFRKKSCLLLKNSQDSGQGNRQKREEYPQLRKV